MHNNVATIETLLFESICEMCQVSPERELDGTRVGVVDLSTKRPPQGLSATERMKARETSKKRSVSVSCSALGPYAKRKKMKANKNKKNATSGGPQQNRAASKFLSFFKRAKPAAPPDLKNKSKPADIVNVGI